MMAVFALPDDIDDRIRRVVDENPRLTIDLVVRDIVRIKFLFHLLEQSLLNDATVVTGGMAMRCYGSRRFTVYDTDTSTSLELDRSMIAQAMTYEDDDVRITPEGITEGRKLFFVQPISYDPYFTTLPLNDPTFKLTMNERGLLRPASWRPFVPGYDFDLGLPNQELPVMAINEVLAEKLFGWWMHGLAKHYADVAWIGALLKRNQLTTDGETIADVRELVEHKAEVNKKWVSAKRLAQLTDEVRRERLDDPDSHLDASGSSWNTISYLGKSQFNPESLKKSVRDVIVPLLFD